jgi:tRNA pseudouridine55 synthase
MKKNKINGVLLLNKPIGISSNAAVQKVKHLFNAEKCGHTGTLDPLASGLLPICLGEATKFSSFLLDGDKEYIATIKLGVTTTSYDAEGDIVTVSDVLVAPEQLMQCIDGFLGTVLQIPPIYSALKVNGRPLYDYARSGNIDDIDINSKARNVTFYELEILTYNLDNNNLIDNLTNDLNKNLNDLNGNLNLDDAVDQCNTVKLRVKCSKGTYIRTLAHDIGQRLNCGAHLIGLVRTQTNSFMLNSQITLNYMENLCDKDRDSLLLPVDSLVDSLPKLDLIESEMVAVRHGNQFYCDKLNDRLNYQSNDRIKNPINENDVSLKCKLYFKDIFLGVATVLDNDRVQPVRLVSDFLG